MGCGKNGTFDIRPDWRQWAVLVNMPKEQLNLTGETSQIIKTVSGFMNKWYRFFNCKVWTIVLEPIEGHGVWDGKNVFGILPKQSVHEGLIAVLTRATIRLARQKNFWKHVQAVADKMFAAPGFITSVGIGEVPWIKQATFSIWESKESMKAFAYKMTEHKEVIKKTKEEKWYSEDMFIRFKVIASYGRLHEKNPLEGKL